MTIKLTREQRRNVKAAISQMDTAMDTLTTVHDELINAGAHARASKAIEAGIAIHGVYRVLSDLADTRNLADGMLRPLLRKRRNIR